MSRIRGIVAKVKKEIVDSGKKKNEPDTTREKDDVEKEEVMELLHKLPKLAEKFEVHRKIGEGTFSSVFLGSLRQESGLPDSKKRWYAIKHLVPTTHPTRVAHELRCLREIGGKNHVIGVDLCLRNFDSVVFIMPYIPHRKFTEYVGEMDTDELRQYMRALMTALRHVHSFGVIHRDVKPSNFLYNRDKRLYALVDFGLAQHTSSDAQPPPAHQSLKRPREHGSPLPCAKRVALDLTMRTRKQNQPPVLPPAHYNPAAARAPCACSGVAGVCDECAAWAPRRANRAGTQGFRPPEVLFKYTDQTTAVDMWAAGVVLASVLTGRYPFFRASDDLDALREIAVLLGSQAMHRTAAALGCRLLTSISGPGLCLRKLAARLCDARAPAPLPRRAPLPDDVCCDCRLPRAMCICRDPSTMDNETFPNRSYAGFPDSAFALAYRLLEPEPQARITAAEALKHPFLASR
ncbi:cdc7 kinase [Choristoneura fumiferana]|uniref:cdc7 kinase n=1 Tax=Choristoneura fumiferana TaxID=7141 RepID=UPI003D15DE74